MSNKKGKSFDGGPIGYKRPPAEHQFKKGQKPPGSGRKKGTKNNSTLMGEVLDSTVKAVINGKQRKMRAREALIRRAVQRGLNGGVNEVRSVFELEERFAPDTNKEQLVIRFQNIDGDDW